MHRSFVHVLALSLLLLGGKASALELGLMLDAGVPDGAIASLAYKPWSFLRIHAGGGTNLVAPGFRTGLTLLLPGAFTVNAEYGHYWDGNANGIWRNISGHPDAEVPSLEQVGYDYANFRLGMELGPSYFKFQINAGLSYINGQVKQLGATLTTAASSEAATVTFGSDPNVTIWTVSARVGFVVYFGL